MDIAMDMVKDTDMERSKRGIIEFTLRVDE